MPITTMDALLASFTAQQRITFAKGIVVGTTVAGQMHTLWNSTGTPAAGSLSIGNTTAGVIPTKATTGAISFNNAATGKRQYLARFAYTPSIVSSLILYDRVWHAGSFTLTALATTSLTGQPALTRPDATGEGLEIWLEVNTTFSASATTLRVNYTNSAGVTGQSSSTTGSLSGFVTGRLINLGRAAGDTGVSKIESITVAGATNAAGTVNIFLARRIATLNSTQIGSGDTLDAIELGMPQISDNSCLAFMVSPTSTSTGTHYGSVAIVSD
jgi:hypothetical protein